MTAVTVLAAGGTIAMAGGLGEGVKPELDAGSLIASVPSLARVDGLQARTISTAPSIQLSGPQSLDIALAAADEAAGGRPVVVTHGTDLLEEVALLCDLIYAGEEPIVFTGAMRPASAVGADGPANLADAVVLAASEQARGLGVVVCFAGEVHAARDVRKTDSAAPSAFGSPRTGPLGTVRESRARLERRVARRAALAVSDMAARVHVVSAGLGDDGALLDAAADLADGVVLVLPGAGHVPPAMLPSLARTAGRLPIVVTVRPERGSLLHGTYGFAGAEGDVRALPVFCAAALSPAAGRVKLMACLGAGLDRAGIAAAFAVDDA